MTQQLKDIKETLQKTEGNKETKNKPIVNFICDQVSFEGITEQLGGCSAQFIISSLAEVGMSILCLSHFFDYEL